jgi:hypothetical protein
MSLPKVLKVKGAVYHPACVLVTERDQYGRPQMGRFVHDEQTVDLSELTASGVAPEFIVVLVNKATWGAPQKEGGERG